MNGPLMSGCPSRELFDRLLQDQLAEAERQSLEEHVETCGRCQDVLDRLARGEDGTRDSWAAARHGPAAVPEDDFLRQLKRNPPSSTASGEPHSWDRAQP